MIKTIRNLAVDDPNPGMVDVANLRQVGISMTKGLSGLTTRLMDAECLIAENGLRGEINWNA